MSIQRNFIFNSILTVSNYLFPFIIYPYAARVLGVQNLGSVNYIDSIVDYAVLFSTLGINLFGVRLIARCGDDRRKRSEAFSSAFFLCLFFTVIVSSILIFATYNVAKFAPYKPLLMVGLIKIWGSLFLINWLYQGIEDFKFITMRTITVKLMYLISIFIFIHKATDYVTYYFLLCMMFAVNASVNCIVARRYVSLTFSLKNILGTFKPLATFGLYVMLTSMYLTFNIFYLGWECGDTQVGYYTTSTKLFQIILGFYTAYTTVVIPRASSMIAQGDTSGFRHVIDKSIGGLMLIAIPVVVYMIAFAAPLVNIFVGPGFNGAILPMRIVMPLILIIGYEQVLVLQILTPIGKDKQVLFNALIGSCVGITLNLLIVNHLQAIGSAIVWVSAEIAVMISAQIFVTRDTGLKFPLKTILTNIIAYLPFIILSYAMVTFAPLSDFIMVVASALLLAIYFIMIQKYYLRNEVYNQMIDFLCKKAPMLESLKYKV